MTLRHSYDDGAFDKVTIFGAPEHDGRKSRRLRSTWSPWRPVETGQREEAANDLRGRCTDAGEVWAYDERLREETLNVR